MPISYVSDNNPDGTSVGTAGSKVSLFGATPVIRPVGQDQAVFNRGQANGLVTQYQTTQTPSAASAGTTAEQTFTVQTGTGGQVLLATGDFIFAVNKPTQQAGLGVGNVRVSSANTLGITFNNVTVGSITPTASQVYSVVALRGMGAISQTLTPASVAANSIVEQTFAITVPTVAGQTGVIVGQLLQVNKPTVQAGLDIVGCRVVSNGVIGITYLNATASPIVPTSEAYSILSMGGLDALNNEMIYGFNVGTVGAIGAGVVATGGSTTLTGLATTDSVTGIWKPTSSAAATNAAAPIGSTVAANTLTLLFAGIGTGATPTASEVYTIRTLRPNPAAPLLNYTQTLTPTSVAALTTAEQTFTVTGLVAGSAVWVNKPSAQAGLGIAGVRVSALNTLAITYVNSTASAITPATEAYIIGNLQVTGPGAGNSVSQMASVWADRVGDFAAALRTALVNLGILTGS